MIDFIKLELIDFNADELQENLLLDFTTKVSVSTGEVGSYMHAYYRALEFKIYFSTIKTPYKRVTVEGSLHKFWNGGRHNFNDFGTQHLIEVLNELNMLFKIDTEKARLRQLEIGVNINPSVETKTILKGCLIHKTKRFKWISTKDEGNYIQAQYQRYIFKLYDKKTHYKQKGFHLPNEIMRIEIKWVKMYDLNLKAITSLQDLLNFKIESFIPLIEKEWRNVIFWDFVVSKKTKIHSKYGNVNYWESLTYENFKHHRKILKNFYSKNNPNIFNEVPILIKKKCKILTSELTENNRLSIRLNPVAIHQRNHLSNYGE